jgi:hypothetical protein
MESSPRASTIHSVGSWDNHFSNKAMAQAQKAETRRPIAPISDRFVFSGNIDNKIEPLFGTSRQSLEHEIRGAALWTFFQPKSVQKSAEVRRIYGPSPKV